MAKSAKIVGPFQIRSEKAKAQSLVELSLDYNKNNNQWRRPNDQ